MQRVPLIIGSILVALIGPAGAQERIAYEDYRLDNGLRVILVQDHSVPIVTIDIWYNVGSANERSGRSGFAHLFEHMMFQGSANVGKAEHGQLVNRAGGTDNGTTNSDRTAYFETLPANRLNLGLWLEADRMRSLAITEENFENQRNAVQEERRLRVDNQPYIGAVLDGLTMLYDSTECFPYAHTVIGSMDDLNAAQVADVQAFFNAYYAPGNATLTVVGDIDPTDAKGLIRQYFADIPAGRQPPPVQCSWKVGTQAQQQTYEDKLATLPAVVTLYRTPGHDDPDSHALQLLDIILGTGESSRLNKKLVRETKSALQIQTLAQSQRWGTPFAAVAIANQGVDAKVIAEQLAAEIARVQTEGVTEDELQKAKNSFRANDIFGRQTTMSIAERVQHFVHFHPSLEEMETDLDAYMAVTREDIQRVARKYLTAANSLTLLVVPEAAKESPVP